MKVETNALVCTFQLIQLVMLEKNSKDDHNVDKC